MSTLKRHPVLTPSSPPPPPPQEQKWPDRNKADCFGVKLCPSSLPEQTVKFDTKFSSIRSEPLHHRGLFCERPTIMAKPMRNIYFFVLMYLFTKE